MHLKVRQYKGGRELGGRDDGEGEAL